MKKLKLLYLLSILPLVLGIESTLLACESEQGYPCTDEVTQTSSSHNKQAETFRRDIQNGRLLVKTNVALDAMLRSAAYNLRRRGFTIEADKMMHEWNGTWSRYLLTAGRDLGDHSPLSIWLAEKHAIIEFLIGVTMCKFLRIHDLYILNYSIPIVFRCLDNVDENEFLLHFSPFLGVVGFWCSYVGCAGATFGVGLLPFICGPLAMGFEWISRDFVAYAVNETVWRLSCQPH